MQSFIRVYVEQHHRSPAGPCEAMSSQAAVNFVLDPGPKVLSMLANLRGSRRRRRANNKKQHFLYLNRLNRNEVHQSDQCTPCACVASRAERRGGASDVDSNVPRISWCVLGPLENTDGRIARKALQDNGNPTPEFDVEDNHVLVTLRKRS